MAWLSFSGSIIAVLMGAMDIQITNAVIGTIQAALNFPLAKGSWLSSSYLIAEIVALPLSGLLLKALGNKRYALIFCSLFMGSSILCTQAWSFPSLIIFRILQGAAGGAMMAFSYNLIIIKLPSSAHLKANTLFGATIALAPTVGPMVAGMISESLGWQSLFYINLPIGMLALGLMMFGLREDLYRPQGKLRIDFFGLVTIVIGLSCLQFVLEEGHSYGWFASDGIAMLAVLAVIALALFVRNELRVREPLVDLFLLRNRQLLISCLANGVTGAALFGCYFLVPYFLITLQAYSPTQISQVILAGGLAQLFTLICMSIALRKINIYALIAAGSFFFLLSAITWRYLALSFSSEWMIIAQILRGFGSTLMLTPLGVLATTSIGKIDAASASILFNISRTLGGALGVAALTALVSQRQARHYAMLIRTDCDVVGFDEFLQQSYQLAFRDTFQIMCAMLMLMFVVFIVLRSQQIFSRH